MTTTVNREPSEAAMRRVVRLLNAISDLCDGDLQSVLKLHRYAGEDGTIELRRNGTVLWPEEPRPQRLLTHRVRGKSIGKTLEKQLVTILSFGEGDIGSTQKRRKALGTTISNFDEKTIPLTP
jgi:hypothetical protein